MEHHVLEVGFSGNALINVGPTKDGIIVPEFQQLLLQLGAWLEINGEAIYDTSPWFYQRDSTDSTIWYTCKKEIYNARNPSSKPKRNDVILAVYAIFLFWPKGDLLLLRDLVDYVKEDGKSRIALLSYDQFKPANVSVFTYLCTE